MRRMYLFLAAAAAVAGLDSCSMDQLGQQEVTFEGEKVELTVSVPLAEQTRADVDSGTDDEKRVASLQVYVFNEDGSRIEAYSKGSGSSLTMRVSLGTKMIAALVNAPDVTEPAAISSLKEVKSLLSHNSSNNFVMFGQCVSAVSSSSEVTVPVTRLAARMVISKITNDIDLPQYKNKPVSVKAIYLVNAPGETDLKSEAAPGVWHNRMQREADCPSLLCADFSASPKSIAKGSSYTSATRLYCYPNPVTADSSSDTWSPRKTRLVVETVIDGKTWYYPITIDGPVKSNFSYEIPELRITRLGSSNPDRPLRFGSATFTVNVSPWTVSPCSSVTI